MIIIFQRHETPNNNRVIYYEDGSFGSEDYNDWDFQISIIDDSTLILNFLKTTGKCTSCEGYFPLNIKKVTFDLINIDNYIDGSLFMKPERDDNNPFGASLNLSIEYRHRDIKNNRIGYGDMNRGELVRFGVGQFARILDGKIIGIIICF
jgi:hypothetical protein